MKFLLLKKYDEILTAPKKNSAGQNKNIAVQ
jgi:hypothetical protein